MASIREEFPVAVPPEEVWSALCDFGAVHERLARGFVVACEPDGDSRVVTFVNGAVAREVLVAVDEDSRRFVYSVVESPLGSTHHNASAQVLPDGEGASRFVWITDVLPHEAASPIREMMALGAAAIRQTLEAPDTA
jgi:carbon monoxide dehydrogenase subunit G